MSAALLSVAVLAACGGGGSAQRQATAAHATTSSTAPATTTIGVDATPTPSSSPSTEPIKLVPCDDRTSYRTTPDWQPGWVPLGFEVEFANTGVNHYAAEPELDSVVAFALVEQDSDGNLLAALTIHRYGDLSEFDPDSATSAGHAIAERGPGSVRGKNGQVVRVIHRSDITGWSEARWIEGGAGWMARSRALTPGALAKALEPLRLRSDHVADTGGRFTLIGHSSLWQTEARETTIGLVDAESAKDPATTLTIVVTQMPGDAEGLADIEGEALAQQSDIRVSNRDGRWLLAGSGRYLTTHSDHSRVLIEYNPSPGSEPRLAEDDLAALIGGLQRVDSAQPFSGALMPAAQSPEPGLSDYCSEVAQG